MADTTVDSMRLTSLWETREKNTENIEKLQKVQQEHEAALFGVKGDNGLNADVKQIKKWILFTLILVGIVAGEKAIELFMHFA